MGDFEFNLDKDKVEKYIAEKILDSSLGDMVEKSLKKFFDKESYFSKSPVEQAIKMLLLQGFVRLSRKC